MANAAWYVAKIKSRLDRQTEVLLASRGFAVYRPVFMNPRKTSASRSEALFPGYLFVHMDVSTTEWTMARSAPGVSYFLGGEHGHPASIAEELVEEIRERIARQAYSRQTCRFRGGQRVRIENGPFAGLDAVFDGCLSPSGRARVLVMMVSRPVPVAIDCVHLDLTV